MANRNFDKNTYNFAQTFNLIAIDLNGDGYPDAIAVCNPKGSYIGTIESGLDNIDINFDRNKLNSAEIINEIMVDINDDGIPDAIAIVNPDGSLIGD